MYNLDYYENLLRLYSASAEEISKRRWNFLKSHIQNLRTVLDYGCGVAWFRAWRPPGVNCYTFDIAMYPQTGVEVMLYDVTCFWDVLEHIPDFKALEPILALSRKVAVSVPIPNDETGLNGWKHFKPGEHLHYFTRDTLNALFHKYGFSLLVEDDFECPPRTDIGSFIYRRL